MSQGTSQQRALARRLDEQYPNNEKIVARPLGRGADIASIRRGFAKPEAILGVPWMNPFNAQKLARDLASSRPARFDRMNPDDRAEYSKRIAQSYKDKERAKELADYRVFELNSDVMATVFALGAFQSINLSADELPLIQTPRSRNMQRFSVRSVGQDGGSRQDQWRDTKSILTYEMEYLQTDKVEYPLMDIQQGSIQAVDGVNEALRYDMEMHIDNLALTNIDALQTASGLRDLLNIHPDIDVNNIPDTNYLDLNGTDTGILTIGKLKTILQHVAAFGSAGGADEPISISSVILSPQNIRDPWDFVSLVSGFSGGDAVEPADTVPNSVRDSIFQSGMFTSAWGHNFSWQPNARLAKGRMYILTSQPVGWYFTKTELDDTLTWEGPDQKEQNLGQVMFRKVVRFLCPDLWKYRIVIIDF